MLRAAVIEECAKVVESYQGRHWLQVPDETVRELRIGDIASAIRQLSSVK